ncbi:hypothetical protein [Flavobacterium algicola]|uniref:hypothetical protein n=1 Tax=Flavobacterium algicola TaxID=556529 RepID=UPI001EFD5E58|nr:hypothetical protein [Flavobacterium algicola]MCG9792419.1 hypothetical protein [Flavobacterium algicola]
MTNLCTTLLLFVITIVSAQEKISSSQEKSAQFEQRMGEAFGLWKADKNTEASDLFESIAAAEPSKWFPNYYVALVNTTTAFRTKDKDQISILLGKAQKALDVEMDKDQSNAELYVMQAMINTAWIVYDPMTNGQKLAGPTMELYTRAEAIAPNNPRVLLSKAEFEIGAAKFWGQDTKPMCTQIEKAIALFATFKPTTPFSPSWGLDRALEAQKKCK